jgi:hypothetical protein
MADKKSSGYSDRKSITRVRSAINGRFKPDGYDEAHPNTTVRERIPLPGRGKK